jgi:GntR family transcriptional regulator of vanillate catabolism
MAIEMADPVPLSRDISQTDRATISIRDMVLRGAFGTGERLTELSLVAMLGVSRTPVRAALQRLADEGLLEATHPSGYLVRGFSETEICDAIEVRGTLEGLAARMAAERGVPQRQLARMRDCLRQIDEAFARADPHDEQMAAYSVPNRRFHALMLGASGSEVVARALERAMSLPWASHSAFVSVWATTPGCMENLRLSQRQHHDIVDALEARSSARVEPLVREHARMARRNFELVLRDSDALKHIAGARLIRRRGTA